MRLSAPKLKFYFLADFFAAAFFVDFFALVFFAPAFFVDFLPPDFLVADFFAAVLLVELPDTDLTAFRTVDSLKELLRDVL